MATEIGWGYPSITKEVEQPTVDEPTVDEEEEAKPQQKKKK